MKKIILTICLVLLTASNVFAGGFGLSTKYEVTDTMAVIYKQNQENAASAGLHLGTLFNYTTDAGMKVFGMGGIILGAQANEGAYTGALGLTVLTFFNDSIQLGANYSPNDNSEKFHFMVGISSVKLISSIGSTVSGLVK